MISEEKIAVALDLVDKTKLDQTLTSLAGSKVWMKIGMEAYYHFGPALVHQCKDKGFRVFLDLKLHDIPTTVEKSLKVLSHLPIDMINVHAAGGIEMMKRASEIIKNSQHKPLLIAVTQLTSTTQEQMNREQKISGELIESVLQYANLAKNSGLNGVVSSPFEVRQIKDECGRDFFCVTPGIRPVGIDSNDQARFMTPMDAIRSGSDLLVIGRPITEASSPALALRKITKGNG